MKRDVPIEGPVALATAAEDRRKTSTSRAFGASASTGDLKGKSIRSGAITVSSQATRFLLYTASSVILGRLLTPKDYGLVGMVTAVTGFLRVLNYAGLSTATVQREVITHELVSTIFWMNLGLGTVMTLLSVVLAPLMVSFYHEPRLYWITVAMASTFLMDAASSQHLALLRRQMRFKALAVFDISSMLVGLGVSIGAALAGLGYWSLVLAQALSPLIPLVGAWLIEPWRPGFPQRASGARSMVRFGGYLTGTDLLDYVFRNTDNVLIGWRWGAVPLGFYQKAYGLLMLPITQVNSPISSVAIATLARLGSDVERKRRYFIRGYSVATAITMPIVVTAAIFAAEIIPFVLGSQWTASVRMFRLLAPAALIGALIGPFGWFFVASGQADRKFRLTLCWTLLTITAFILGLKYGPEGVATAYSCMAILLAGPVCLYFIHQSPIRFGDIVASLKYPFMATAFAGGVGFWLETHGLTGLPLSVRAIGGPAGALLAYAFFLLIVLRQWQAYKELLTHLLPSRRAAQ